VNSATQLFIKAINISIYNDFTYRCRDFDVEQINYRSLQLIGAAMS